MSAAFSGPVPVPAAQASPLRVLITGASRGIGLELVKQYAAAHPQNVVIAAVRDPSGAAIQTAAAGFRNVHVVQLDVDSEASIQKSVEQVKRITPSLDVLFNNAGILGDDKAADPLTVTAQQLQAVFQTNVTGVLLTTQLYLPLLRQSPHPKVINVSSLLGSNGAANLMGKPTAAYGLSKAALNYLTTAFRYAEPKVTFLSIHPGWVQTDLGNALGAAPTEIGHSAQAIRYYTAEKSAASSGEFLDVPSGKPIAF